VTPRAVQPRLPVWVGVGGTPASAVRAGQLGLPMILGYIGGPAERLIALADLYR
jgi:alkanesulfonate monooxygenase SsuD/methylene tetrahydromethanopterin reductase-like flavin-dependent oxidoreductase (luciferase family)